MIEHSDQFIAEIMDMLDVLDQPARRVGNVFVTYSSATDGEIELKIVILYGKPYLDGFSYQYYFETKALAERKIGMETFDKLCYLIKPYERDMQLGQFVKS